MRPGASDLTCSLAHACLPRLACGGMTSAIGLQQAQHDETSFAVGLGSVVATQINSCVEFLRGSFSTLLGQASGPCACSGVSPCLKKAAQLCIFTGRTEGFAVPNGFARLRVYMAFCDAPAML